MLSIRNNKIILLIFVIYLLLIILRPSIAQDEPNEIDYKKHVYFISVKYKNGFHGSGSGFFISNDGLMMTANHVINNSVSAKVYHRGSQYDVIAVVSNSVIHDLALVKVKIPESKVNTLDVDKDWYDKEDRSVKYFGYPGGKYSLYESKMIEINKSPDQIKMFSVTGPARGGISGGPVVNSENEVIGVVVKRQGGIGMVEKMIFSGIMLAIPSSKFDKMYKSLKIMFPAYGPPPKSWIEYWKSYINKFRRD